MKITGKAAGDLKLNEIPKLKATKQEYELEDLDISVTTVIYYLILVFVKAWNHVFHQILDALWIVFRVLKVQELCLIKFIIKIHVSSSKLIEEFCKDFLWIADVIYKMVRKRTRQLTSQCSAWFPWILSAWMIYGTVRPNSEIIMIECFFQEFHLGTMYDTGILIYSHTFLGATFTCIHV